MFINEQYIPDEYQTYTGNVKLYQGTDVEAINSILESGVISASMGRSTGETIGINWFSTKYSDNFGMGSVFSIEVPMELFNNGEFCFENRCEVTSKAREVPIDGLNFTIEQIGSWKGEVFTNIYKRIKERGGDLFDWLRYICERNEELSKADYFIETPVIKYLVKQLFGPGELENIGIMESFLREYVDEVEASDLSLDSFTPQEELQPDIWPNGELDPDVRNALLEVAQDFLDELEIKWTKPKDVIFTGSLANYNWSKFSDIDMHIIMDFSEIFEDTELIEDYFDAKKNLWNSEHEGLTMYGFPVEIYVEDIKTESESSGKYSLLRNEWIVEPKDLSDAELNEDYIKEESAKIMTKIDDLEETVDDPTTVYKKAERLFDYMKDLRQQGLATPSKEMSSGNIIWKVIRREGYIDKLCDLMTDSYDKTKSIF